MKEYLDQIIADWVPNQDKQQKIISLFERVRDIPYGQIGSRDPIDVYKQNKGTCSGKHMLLSALYRHIGVEVHDYLILHRFKDLPVSFPTNIQQILNDYDIVDPHNFIKIKVGDQLLTIDITWDLPMKKLGFPVVEKWDGKTNIPLAVVTKEEEIATDKPIEKKKELLAQLPENIVNKRKEFLEEATIWIDQQRNSGLI